MIDRCRELKLRAVGPERKLRMDFTVLLTAKTVHSLYSPSRRQWFALHHLRQRVDNRGAKEGRNAGEQLVENGAERVDIGRRTEFLDFALRLFGRHVTGRAGDGPLTGLSAVAFQLFGEAEVGDFGNEIGEPGA